VLFEVSTDRGFEPKGLVTMGCDVYDVNRFRPNNTVDDTVAINNAIIEAVAAGGGIVYLPARNYFLESGPIVVPFAAESSPYQFAPTIQIVGDGPDATIVRRGGGTSATWDLMQILRGFTTVEGVAMDGAGGAGLGNGVVVGDASGTSRVLRRIQLHNCIVRNSARINLYIRGGTATSTAISILCSYTDCIFARNRDANLASVYIEQRNTSQFFRGCTIDAFSGSGLYAIGCDGLMLNNCHIEWQESDVDNKAYLHLTNCRACDINACWFEESRDVILPPPPPPPPVVAGYPANWFILLEDACDGIGIRNSLFVRKKNTTDNGARPTKAIGIGSAGPCRGVSIHNPTIIQATTPPVGDSPIVILNDNSEVLLEGGVLEYGTTHKIVEVNDQSNRSSSMSMGRRIRLPRLVPGDLVESEFMGANRRVSDVVNRYINQTGSVVRVGTGLEAFSSAGAWIPLTVNRYTDDTLLTAETSKDRGTLAWVDSGPGSLKAYDGTTWRHIVRRVAEYDAASDAGYAQVSPLTLWTPTAVGLYTVGIVATTTTVTDPSQTLLFVLEWSDELGTSPRPGRSFQLNLATVGNYVEMRYAIYAAAQPVVLYTNTVLPTGRFAIHVRVEAL
jgi:hypothetical protein